MGRKKDDTVRPCDWPLDKVGREILPGCFLVYGHALGRCAGLRIGKALAVNWRIANEDKYEWFDPHWEVIVWGVDDDWEEQHGLQLCSTRGTLLFPDRMVVLPDAMLPAAYKALLDPVTMDTKRKKRE